MLWIHPLCWCCQWCHFPVWSMIHLKLIGFKVKLNSANRSLIRTDRRCIMQMRCYPLSRLICMRQYRRIAYSEFNWFDQSVQFFGHCTFQFQPIILAILPPAIAAYAVGLISRGISVPRGPVSSFWFSDFTELNNNNGLYNVPMNN